MVVPETVSWSLPRVLQAIGAFSLSAMLELLGGWLIWRGIRLSVSPRLLYASLGAFVCAAYGFAALLQPPVPAAQFSRVYAAYGAFFVAMSYLWGFVESHVGGEVTQFDWADVTGATLACVGGSLCFFWPR